MEEKELVERVEAVGHVNGLASKGLGKHVGGAKGIGRQVQVANESKSLARASHGNKAVVRTEQVSVSVKQNGVELREGNALAAANCDGMMTHLLERGGCGHGVDQVFRAWRVGCDSNNGSLF